MAVSVQCTGVTRGEAGQLFVNWDDGTQSEYGSVSQAFNACVEMDSDESLARKFLIGDWLRRDPSGANPSQFIVGKTCVLAATAVDKVTIT